MRTCFKLVGFIILHSACVYYCKGQASQIKQYIPTMLPKSPDMASVYKFTDVPVNYYTGVPDISIPLYEIKQGDISIPISISYHAGGIKVSEKSSWVGLGWALNTGASVSRNIMGLPDEQSQGYFSGNTVKKESDYDKYSSTWLDYLWNTSQGVLDGEPDVFQFKVGTKNASFLFNQTNNYAPIITPYTPVKITKRGNLFFDITDDDGTLYKFDKAELTSNQNGGNNPVSAYSSWQVTQVISANKQDTIQYNYTSSTSPLTIQFDEINSISVSDEVSGTPDNGKVGYTPDNGSGATVWLQQITNVNPMKPSIITFENGKIVFEKNTSVRTDLANDNALKSISIMALDAVNNIYILIKKINFFQTYFITGTDNNTARLRLDSVVVQDKNGINVERYKFEYNSLMLPGYGSKMIDYWGYYNNKNNNTLVPQMQIPYQPVAQVTTITIGSTVANGRDCDSNYMQGCTLKRIYYPTGGYTEFQYETNQYKDDQNAIQLAGGLRIKTIKSYDGNSTVPIVKTYKYGDGYPFFSLKDCFFQSEQSNNNWNNPYGASAWYKKRVRTYMTNPSVSLSSYEGYTVGYPNITEYAGDETTNTGKTDFSFNNVSDGVITLVPAINKPEKFMYNMNRGQLTLKTVYRKNADNSYSPVFSLSNHYGAFNDIMYPNIGFVSSKRIINDFNSPNVKCAPQGGGNAGCYEVPENYIYTNFSFRAADNKLIGTSETTYDQVDPLKSITKFTTYYYDNFSHQQITRSATTNSKGETSKTNLKYPGDFAGNLPYDTMVNRNIINKVVQERDSLNSTLVSIQRTNYADAGNGNILPSTIEVQTGSYPTETRALFQNYDTAGNILQMQKANDVKTSFQWSNRYPVVQALNAQNTLVYTKSAALKSGTVTYVPNNLQQQNASFTSFTVANITISLSFSGIPNTGTTSTFSYSLAGAATRTGVLCTNRSGNCGSNLTNVTFNNMPAGDYTLSLSPSSNNSTVNVVVTYGYTGYNVISSGTKEFFYEGFENNIAASTANPCAGNRYYSGDYTIPYTKPTAGNYLVDYHYLSLGKWYAVTKTFANSMVLTDGDAIDEVRIYPETAQLTTMTYTPLIGMTSQCDAANHITHYEYDGLSRLKLVRDADGNILKKIDYHHAGQAESSPTCACDDAVTGKICLNGQCEQGIRVNTSTSKQPDGTWKCVYHYEWSDGTSGPNRYEINATACIIN